MKKNFLLNTGIRLFFFLNCFIELIQQVFLTQKTGLLALATIIHLNIQI